MKYYRVKQEFDNCNVYGPTKNGKALIPYTVLVGNELYTPCQYKNFDGTKGARFYRMPGNNKPYTVRDIFEIVDINRNNTYWAFGARFAD